MQTCPRRYYYFEPDMTEFPLAIPSREVGPGKAIRFAVGSQSGLRSTSWTIWSAKNTQDVYMAPRKLAGVKKISFHKSGSWSYSFINSEKVLSQLPEKMSRHTDIWQRPESLGEGWRRGYEIIVPWTELRKWPDCESGDIVFAPPPPHGYWTCIEVFFAEAGDARLNVTNPTFAIGRMSLVDQSQVHIFAQLVRPTPAASRQLAIDRDKGLSQAADFISSSSQPGNLRLSLMGYHDDNTRFTFDLAVQAAPPGEVVICTSWPEPQVNKVR
jgi:hypothetical protein